jgi:hypothetical protein
MSVLGVRGGPHEGVAAAELPGLVSMAGRAGARRITHDPVENVSGFVIAAPTPPHAFAVVRDIFCSLYGNSWWAEVSTFSNLN